MNFASSDGLTVTVPPMSAAVFHVAPQRESAVTRLLAEKRVSLPRPQWRSTTVLDTFDGRLHRQGWRLEMAEGRLRLRNGADLVVDLADRPPPRTVDDVRDEHLRGLLAPVVGDRALLPLAVVLSLCSSARGGGLTVTLHHRVHVEGHPDLRGLQLEVEALPRTLQRFTTSLAGLGVLPGEEDHVLAAVRGAGRDLAGRSSQPASTIDRTMSAEAGFRAVLLDLVGTVGANWEGALGHRDPEFLHDLRVAVRRSRSVMKLGKGVLRAPEVSAAYSHLSWIGSQTSKARDLDVYVQEWDRYTADLGDELRSDLAPLKALLESHLDAEYSSMSEVLGTRHAARATEAWQSWLENGQTNVGKRRESPLADVIAREADRAFERLIKNGRAIGRRSPAQDLHDLRKDAKRLRYVVECFGPLFDEDGLQVFIRRLKRLQDNLGTHQDAEVHVAHLHRLAKELADRGAGRPTLDALEVLATHLDRERKTARRSFHTCFAEFDAKAGAAAYRRLRASLTG